MAWQARELENAIMLEASKHGIVLGKNAKGMFRQLYSENKQKAGLLLPGSSDLIGWTSITITPAMVGSKVAIYTAAEIKAGRDTLKDDQANFLGQVSAAGGIAGVARSVEDFLEIIKNSSCK